MLVRIPSLSINFYPFIALFIKFSIIELSRKNFGSGKMDLTIEYRNRNIKKKFFSNFLINFFFLFKEATSDVLTGGDTLTLKDLGVTNLTEFENMGAWHCLQRSFIRSVFLSDPWIIRKKNWTKQFHF